MPSFEGDALFVKELFGFAVSIITIIGVPVAFYKANSLRSTRLLSDLAMEEDEMGYFTAFRRCWLWAFALVYIPTVKVPRVPSVGTLIRAGDDGVWSSAMLLDGRSPGGRAKDPVVSWVRIYEAFFREYAWALDRYEVDGDDAGKWEMEYQWRVVIEGESMKNYKEEGAFEVWKLKHRVSSYAWERHTRSRWAWLFRVCRSWCIRRILYPIDMSCHSFLLFMHTVLYTYESLRGHVIRLSHELNSVDIELDFIPRVDRHLFYYPWRIFAKESTLPKGPRSSLGEAAPAGRNPKDIRPTLVSCVRPLEHLYSMSTANTGQQLPSRRNLEGDEKGQRLRIFNQVPALKISEEDLGALCMVLGIKTKGEPDSFLPHGRGALGHLLSSHRENGMNVVRLGYHDQTDLADGRPAGSGYSTLFAKHLTCGCIPFGWSTTKQGIPMLHTITFNQKVDRLLREGSCISDANPPPGEGASFWAPKSIEFLEHMPKNADSINFYSEHYTGPANGHQHGIGGQESMRLSYYAFSEEVAAGQSLVVREDFRLIENTPQSLEKDSMGSIYPIDNRTKVPYCCRKWSQVVAGIAFGGLVPLTTRRLAKLVEFSVGVGAKLEGDDMKAFRSLAKLVVDEFSTQTCRASGDGALLFGKRLIKSIKHDLDGVSVDFDSEASGTNQSARELTRTFEWLTTLLEALVAMVKEKSRASSPSLVVGSVFKRGQWKRDDVYEACARQIQDSYVAMVKGEDLSHRGIAELLRDPIKELEAKKREISAENCGTVARCIIMAWSRLVRIVEWDGDNGDVVQDSWDDQDRRKPWKLLTLEDLPDIALWE